MAVVNVIAGKPGTFHHRGGTTTFTAARSKAWQDKFRKLTAPGEENEFPVPWSHMVDDKGKTLAMPNDKRFAASRFNAGKILDIAALDDGRVRLKLDAPGLDVEDGKLVGLATLPNGNVVKTAIGNVSLGILPKWTDGKGVEHEDVIGHCALETLPVIAGMGGFEALATDKPGEIICLSTPVVLATESDDGEETKSKLKKIAKSESGDEEEEDLDTILSNPGSDESSEDQIDAQIIALCNEGGISLPPDTNGENLKDRLLTALTVLIEAKKRKMAEDKAKEEAAKEAAGSVEEESGPAPNVMLATEVRELMKNPLVKNMVMTQRDTIKKTRADRIAALGRRGLKPAEAGELSAKPIFLSTIIGADGKFRDDDTDKLIGFLERCLPTEKEYAAVYLGMMTGLTEEASPLDRDQPTENVGGVQMSKDQKAEAEKLASLAGVKPKA